LESENSELRADIAKLSTENDAILRQLQNVIDTKLALEFEMAAYRKLLDSDESRSATDTDTCNMPSCRPLYDYRRRLASEHASAASIVKSHSAIHKSRRIENS